MVVLLIPQEGITQVLGAEGVAMVIPTARVVEREDTQALGVMACQTVTTALPAIPVMVAAVAAVGLLIHKLP
jgi:hypothetical protein